MEEFTNRSFKKKSGTKLQICLFYLKNSKCPSTKSKIIILTVSSKKYGIAVDCRIVYKLAHNESKFTKIIYTASPI